VTVLANERRELRANENADSIIANPSDEGLLNGVNLFNYQKNIFAKMVTAKRAICSMVMGAGKTLTTIACYAWIRKHRNPNARLLVICPKSLRIQWANEIKRVTNLDSTQVMRKEDLTLDTPVFVATYQWYAKNHAAFLEQNFEVLVADEIQYVKNSESKTWKALSKIKTEYFFGLSGTVIENRLDDLYSISESGQHYSH
jgi:SNF2 family DNA or RNA helicase